MLTLQPGDIFADNYKLTRLVDTGGFAEVWEAVFLTAGNTVALKIFPKLDADGVRNIEEEYKSQSELSHTNLLIARYFGKFNGHPFLEMRFCSGGNALAKVGQCAESDMAKCLNQVAAALDYLHENNIVHQDIKPNNFLLDSNGNYYLADLGLSLKVRTTIKKYTQSTQATTSSIQTGVTPPPYRAPELYDRSAIGADPIKASDIWALGASLYEMATGQVPFGEFGGLIQLNQPDVPELPEQFSRQLNSIVMQCLAKETWNRPKASDLAEWAKNFLTKGNYGVPAATASAASGNAGGNTDDTKTVMQPAPNRKKRNRVVVWTIMILGLAASGWGIKALIDKNSYPIIIDTDIIPDSSRANKDSLVSTMDSTTLVQKTDSVYTPPNALQTKEDLEDKPKTENKPKVDVIYYPSIDRRPLGTIITITKVERTPRNVIITFLLKNSDGSSSFTIYGPEDPKHCFHLEASRVKYKMLSVSAKGEVRFNADGTRTFTATFEKVPDHISKVNIWEGTDFTRKEMNYWNFRGVQIKK